MQAPYFPGPTPVQQPVRVRLACDSCSAAKVKCDKERPACERCSSNQLQCVYSISRRHGCKRRAAGDPAAAANGLSIVPQKSPRGSGGGSSASRGRRLDCDTVDFSAYDNNHGNGSSTVNEDLNFHIDNDLPDPFQYLGDDDFSMNVDVDGSGSSSFAFAHSLPSPFETCHDRNSSTKQQMPGQAPCTPFTTPSTSSINGEDMTISGLNVTVSAASKALAAGYHRPRDSYSSSSQFASSEEPRETHNCEAYGLSLLRSLHHWPLYSHEKHSQVMPSDQSGTHADSYQTNGNANPEVLPSLDTILHANKCALSGVVKLLGCSCARRPHLATLYISIITKMLSLYELAATADIASSESPSSATPASSTQTSSGPRLARTTIMQVGVFNLDEDDQETLQRGILLRQLRNMERAIERFASLGGGDTNDHDLSLRQWHSAAVSMIKKELQRIYQSCKERLLIIA
ncbi:MAG: hypothetical protein Q9186_005795 [Xanthomendoza sp. 1 TL-2023]